MIIDPRTVLLLAGVMGGIMSIVLYFMHRNYPTSIQGLGAWAAAPALIFVSLLLLGARGMVPQFLSVIVANALLLGGLSTFYYGTQRFLRLPTSLRPWIVVVLGPLPILAWFTYFDPHYGMRVVVISLVMTALTTSMGIVLLRHGRHGFATMFTVVALLLQSLAQIMRFINALDIPPDSSMFILSPAQQIYVTSYTFCLLMAMVGIVLMATEELRREFEHQASHDSLTGALTRRAFLEACDQELERGRRKDRSTALLMMDLDHFKAINDNYGHQAGDHVLMDFVARVGTLLRRPDQFGRFGGEEFVALLPETSMDEARVVAERIRAETESASGQPGCTVSIGIAASVPGENSIDTLLHRADEALYRAKADGRNCVRAAA